MEILDIKNLSFTYPEEKKCAIENINLKVEHGEFIVVCGHSGCGKTTLFKLIKSEIAPLGKKEGKILFCGTDIEELSEKDKAAKIGFVNQNPEAQIVTDRVYHELSFGLENLGKPSDEIKLRIAEMSSYFGISDSFNKKTAHLSGGQKQLVSLASVMAMSPELLILDEPTSQLDPIAASDFIATLQKINRELGTTVIISEHRLEELFPIADKIAVMEKGKLLIFDTPKNVCEKISDENIMLSFPTAARIWNALGKTGECPLDVRGGREFLMKNFSPKSVIRQESTAMEKETVLSIRDVFFRYDKNGKDILKGVNLDVSKGEFFCLLGGNGAGKTTLLKILSGTEKPYRGKIKIFGKSIEKYSSEELHRKNTALLPQNVADIFIKSKVKDDLYDICALFGDSKKDTETKIENVCRALGIMSLLEKHPYDISCGEIQKCAIAKLLLTEPQILFLDEPTKALDSAAKKEFAKIISDLKSNGVTIVAVTHDVEFAAENADRCALFFEGEIIASSKKEKFFSDNNFYTTAASRIARGIFDGAVTADDIIKAGKCEEP